jgi:CRISPR/Cas system-associated protein Cas5 (RAMP superfamily)
MKNNATDYITTLYLPTASTSKGSIVCPALKGEEVVVTYDGTVKQSDTLIFINATANGTNSTNEVPQGE